MAFNGREKKGCDAWGFSETVHKLQWGLMKKEKIWIAQEIPCCSLFTSYKCTALQISAAVFILEVMSTEMNKRDTCSELSILSDCLELD